MRVALAYSFEFRRAIFPCCALLFIVMTAGCSDSTQPASSPSSDNAEVTQTVSVQVAKAEITTLKPSLDLVGMITAIPEKTAVISSQLGGWVRKLDVVEGQSIHAEDLIVELDDRSSKVAVQRAKAIAAEKEAAVKRLKSGYLPEEIAGARQDADKAAATVDGLRNELTALKKLLDRNEISSVFYETKAKALKSAEAAMASAKERVKLLEAGTRVELIEEAQGLLDAAKADLEQAKLALKWCSITSPIDGVVVQLLARQGQFIDRAVSLTTVMNLEEVFVQIRIPGTQFANVKQGSPVSIQLSSLAGKSYTGKVTRISGQADPATGNIIVFATIKNKDYLLRPGLSCQVKVSLPEIKDALVIPVTAVADHSGTPVVTVIRDNKAYETKVETGIETSNLVQILKGLTPGDLVATAGGYGLPEQCPVTITKERQN